MRPTAIFLPGTRFCITEPASEKIVSTWQNQGLDDAKGVFLIFQSQDFCATLPVRFRGMRTEIVMTKIVSSGDGDLEKVVVVKTYVPGRRSPLFIIAASRIRGRKIGI